MPKPHSPGTNSSIGYVALCASPDGLNFHDAFEEKLTELRQFVFQEHDRALSRRRSLSTVFSKPRLKSPARAKPEALDVTPYLTKDDACEHGGAKIVVPTPVLRGGAVGGGQGKPLTPRQPVIDNKCHIGEGSISLENDVWSESVTDRWCNLYVKMQSPQGRNQLTQTLISNTHALHSVWASILSRSRASAGQKLLKPLTSSLTRQKTEAEALRDCGAEMPNGGLRVLHPSSKANIAWVVAAIILLLYDIIMVTLSIGFDLESDYATVSGWITRCFWTLDLLRNFFVGRYVGVFLEMNCSVASCAYLKTWFLFDFLLVCVDWLSLFLNRDESGISFGAFGRGFRMFRLVRVLHIGQWADDFRRSVLKSRRLTQDQKEIFLFGAKIVNMTLVWIFCTHATACFWHALGKSQGDSWTASVHGGTSHKYFISVHWVLSQVHGTSYTAPSSALDWGIAVLTSATGMILFSLFVAKITVTCLQFTDLDDEKLHQASERYMANPDISRMTLQQVKDHMKCRRQQVSRAQQLKQDALLLDTFPMGLRSDILEETRRGVLSSLPFFNFLSFLSRRTLRCICRDLKETLIIKNEVLFNAGDECGQSFFVNQGSIQYVHSLNSELENEARATPSQEISRDSISGDNNATKLFSEWGKSTTMAQSKRFGSQVITAGRHFCEVVLWSPWVNVGDALSMSDTILFRLGAAHFAKSATLRSDVALLTARYAQKFIGELMEETIPSDLFGIAYSRDDVAESFAIQDREKHMLFLSHYKAEAGTEATLLHEAFKRMLLEDRKIGAPPTVHTLDVPVFIDSENLTDLRALKRHVEISETLVLLLTPNVYLRPWCLLEIVTAVRQGILIVPVEIQRPGMHFTYPDEEFYSQISSGQLIDAESMRMLAQESVEPGELETAIRSVSSQIALPFSPHKSQAIRDAEMHDILRRCCQRGRATWSSSVRLSLQMQWIASGKTVRTEAG